MSQLQTTDPGALRLLMTEDLFCIRKEQPVIQTDNSINLPEPKPDSAVIQPDLPIDFSYLGENNKYFLILINDQKHTHLNKEHQEMLVKILQAKTMELRDVAILNLNRYPGILFNSLKEFFAPSRVVLFGVDPQTIGLPGMGSNEPQKINDVKTLATYNFEEMKNDVDKKRAFWNVLKSF